MNYYREYYNELLTEKFALLVVSEIPTLKHYTEDRIGVINMKLVYADTLASVQEWKELDEVLYIKKKRA